MNKKSYLPSLVSAAAGILAMAILMGTTTAANALLFDQNITPDVIFGTGNANGSFTVDRNAGVELGLRAKIPFAGIIHSNGDGSYTYTLAETDHDGNPATAQRWNFDWTVNTNFNGSSGSNINAFTYRLGIDFDPSSATDFAEFDPITPTPAVPFFDHAIGTNATANGGGTEATTEAEYLTLIGANNVAQNSWRHSFFPIHPTLVYDPTIDGTYDIALTALNQAGAAVASTRIQVIIGAGGAVVPEPGTLGLIAFGLAGLAFARRRKAA